MSTLTTLGIQADRLAIDTTDERQIVHSSKHIPEVDGLRGIAIAMILLFHNWVFAIATALGSPLAYFMASFRLAGTGVDLFFVISGFLIGGILLDTKHSKNYFKIFFIRRVCRILPLYFLVLAIGLLIKILTDHLDIQLPKILFGNAAPIISYLTFIQNFWMGYVNDFGARWYDVTWSLAVEEQFYLILPLLIRHIPSKRLVYFLLFIICAAPVLRTLLVLQNPGTLAAYVLLPSRADALCLGVLAAWLTRNPRTMRWLVTHPYTIYIPFIILLFGMGIFTMYRGFILTSIGYTCIALFYFFILIIILLFPGNMLGKLMRFTILQRLGTISFGVYLLHKPVDYLLHGFIFGRDPRIDSVESLLVSILSTTLILMLASLSMKYFERPIITYGRQLKYIS